MATACTIPSSHWVQIGSELACSNSEATIASFRLADFVSTMHLMLARIAWINLTN
mgnify:CR=1 FL=1